MAADVGTPADPAAGGARKASTAWRLFRITLIGALVSIALLIAVPPTGIIKDQIARSIGTSIGRKVTIGGLRFKIRPKLEAEFDQVTVSNPEGMAGDVLKAATVKATMDLLPLLKGRLKIDSVAVIKPIVALDEDPNGVKNWVFTPPAGTSTGFRLPAVTTVEDGALTFVSRLTGASRAASAIGATISLDPISAVLTSKGQMTANGEPLVFDVTLGDYDAVVAGTSSTLKASINGRPVTASIDGDALFAAAAEFTGSLDASSPSLLEFAQWAGADTTPSGEPLKTSLSGKIAVTTRDVTFTETNVMINTTSSRFDGALDLGGPRPKLSGTIASEHIDLGRMAGVGRRTALAPEAEAMPMTDFEPLIAPGWASLLDDITALEKAPAASAQAERLSSDAEPQSAAAAAASPSAWSEQPFNLRAIKAIDLDVLITASAISYGALDLKDGRVKTAITDGVLDATLEQLAMGAGKAAGTLSIDSRASPPKAIVALTLTEVDAEPVITEIAGKPLLSGPSNVTINASASGQNQSQLTSTLEGKASFQMGKGALRGFDVRRMISEWWKSWKFDLAMKTGFQKLEAQYDIKKGIMRSQPGFSLDGSEVEINSVGSVNVPAKRLNQEIRVKVVPPPTALPIPVRISGDWSKPSIGIDWSGIFSAGPNVAGQSLAVPGLDGSGLDGPQAVAAATEPPPAEVQAAIRRVLDADLPPDRLSPEGRRMLQSLLPADVPTDATP